MNSIAEDYEDAKIYAKLREEDPEGLSPVGEKEKKDFESWLGV